MSGPRRANRWRLRVAELEAECDRLRAALKPFAMMADQYFDHVRSDAVKWHCGDVTISLGDIRRARAALAALNPTPEGGGG